MLCARLPWARQAWRSPLGSGVLSFTPQCSSSSSLFHRSRPHSCAIARGAPLLRAQGGAVLAPGGPSARAQHTPRFARLLSSAAGRGGCVHAFAPPSGQCRRGVFLVAHPPPGDLAGDAGLGLLFLRVMRMQCRSVVADGTPGGGIPLSARRRSWEGAPSPYHLHHGMRALNAPRRAAPGQTTFDLNSTCHPTRHPPRRRGPAALCPLEGSAAPLGRA
jgi:hypothetical protein